MREKNRTTNELEFQGTVLSWLSHELTRRHLGLEMVSQEPSKSDRRRNDLVVWKHRASGDAFLTIELKTPATPIGDLALLNDACTKAQRWQAPFFAIWNMQAAELYRTPPSGSMATPKDRLSTYDPLRCVKQVDDWIDPSCREQLRLRALAILDEAYVAATRSGMELRLDPSVFVDRLTNRVGELRAETVPALQGLATRRKSVKRRLREIAAAQGFIGLIDDIPAAVAGQYCYRLAGQVLFYFALRRKQPTLRSLEIEEARPFLEAVKPFWADVRRYDYEALFEPHELDDLVPLTDKAEQLLRGLVDDFARYDWNTLADDVLGAIFEHLIPRQEQVLLGQFYTPSPVADLLLAFAVDGDQPLLLDPGCGSGTFLLRAYQYLQETRKLRHEELLPNIWGFDISPFASELAVINLFRQDLSEFSNFPRVLCGDFFSRNVGDAVDFPPARGGGQKKISLPIPSFDAVVANPPYLRSQNQDDLDPAYKERLFAAVVRDHGIEAPSKTDLFAFFVYHTHPFLRIGGRLAFVTSASWLTADYGYWLQRFLLERFRLVAVVASEAESYFSQVEQNTVLFVAEKRPPDDRPSSSELIRFVTLKHTLTDLSPDGPDYWDRVGRLADELEAVSATVEEPHFRAKCVSAASELSALQSETAVRNWSVFLRAPAVYWRLLESDPSAFAPLEELAEVHLGYKSLQNQFFYVGRETIESYGIEEEYLEPVFRMDDIDAQAYLQGTDSSTFLFLCDRPEADIRGSGAYRYIGTMENRSATDRKQGRGGKTVAEALAEQGGPTWYAPKATPHRAHVWLRKAFDGTYAPFVFEAPQVLDQRCNYVAPRPELRWEEVAAVLTTSLFALGVEAAGSASMGAGALEVPTTKLSRQLVVDVRRWSKTNRRRLVALARRVWEQKAIVKWTNAESSVPPVLTALDDFVLSQIADGIKGSEVYEGIRSAVEARRLLAEGKAKTRKAAEKADLELVADGIIKGIGSQLEATRFPESFCPSGADLDTIELAPTQSLVLHRRPFLGTVDLTVSDQSGAAEFEGSLPESVVDVIVRSLLMGRRAFSYPRDEDVASTVLSSFFGWIQPLLDELHGACATSSLGSKYEGDVLRTALLRLGWSPYLAELDLPEKLQLPARQ